MARAKLNVLDAIHYIGTSKSYFSAVDQITIMKGEQYFSLIADFERDGQERIQCVLQQGQSKVMKRNGKAYERLSDHVGQFPVVMITPGDIYLLLEGSAERRRFFDLVICQVNRPYLQALGQYNRLIEQRNRHLLQARQHNHVDNDLLAALDMQLVPLAELVYQERKAFLDEFTPVFINHYQQLSGGAEVPSVVYASQLHEQRMAVWLEQNRYRDLAAERTTAGVHKDDWEFFLDDFPVKRYASQGQNKSFVIALKLAQYDYLCARCGKRPLLLLDDIFEKIDGLRGQRLMQLIAAETFGQIFITDTHPERLHQTLDTLSIDVKHFTLPL